MDNQEQLNSLASFQKAKDGMILTNASTYGTGRETWDARMTRLHLYTLDEVEEIIARSTLTAKQKLSRDFFHQDGYYRQIITHYSTLLKYCGLLIPIVDPNANISPAKVKQRYQKALDFIENADLPVVLTNCAMRALIDGCYYGLRAASDKNRLVLIDLPPQYCRTRFKDTQGNDLVEFDLTYFSSIVNVVERDEMLAAYPEEVAAAYRKYAAEGGCNWYIVPNDIGVCFPLFDGYPPFLRAIEAILKYDQTMADERNRDLEGTHKTLVQKVPHLSDGRLVFEPDEAQVMHDGTVGMLKGNKNISVLTTYADVDCIDSSSSLEGVNERLSRAEQNIYAQAGVSGQIFASTGSQALNSSLNEDLSFMMYLAHKFEHYINFVTNSQYGNNTVRFSYKILPVTAFNEKDYIDEAFKLVGSGYSILIPAIAQGVSQRELGNLKYLENDILGLMDKLKPLQTSYTQSDSSDSGRPSVPEEQKAEQTVKNADSKNNN